MSGEKISTERIRKMLGLTQDWCAKKMKISRKTIYNLETKDAPEYYEFLMNIYRKVCQGKIHDLPKEAVQMENTRRHLTQEYLKRWGLKD